MNITQLPSGSYRIRQTYQGKVYSKTVPYKPTKKEAIQLVAELFEDAPHTAKSTDSRSFGVAVNNFIIECEKGGKSPSTVCGYLSLFRNMSDEFKEIRTSDLTNNDIVKECDRYSSIHSPKTTRNFYSLIKSVVAECRPEMRVSYKLPTKEKKFEYEPTTEDVMRILDVATGTRYEAVLKLCCLALRRGEAIAVTSADIDDNNILTINKDIVPDKNYKYVLKDRPKTSASNRRILIPQSLADLIREQGKAFDGNPHTINEYLHKVQDQLGIPRFRLHILRHFAAAYLLKNGFSMVEIEKYGGWEKGSQVLASIYSYNLDPHESQKQISASFCNLM